MAEQRFFDTLPPDVVSDELAPTIAALGLEENCRQLAEEGWTILRSPAEMNVTVRLRQAILDLTDGRPGRNMLLHQDPVFAEAVLNEQLVAMAEYSVGRGFLLSQVAASVRGKGTPSIGLHADNNWLPAPFPDHNMLLTACWVCDEYSQQCGGTLVIPGSNNLRRHPNAEETEALQGAIPVECEAGSVVLWDGNLWHSNYPREVDGERVVCHITYSRLALRPVENYQSQATALVEQYGDTMAQMLGFDDFLDSPTGADYSKLTQTFNNAKR